MTRAEQAVSLFEEGFCCSQAVFAGFAADLGLDTPLALKIADAFGAGMGGRAETCGVVTGAMMVIGLKYGRTDPNDEKARAKTRRLVRNFVKEFSDQHGCLTCKELLGYNISTADGMEQATRAGVFDTVCPGLIREAMQILEKILASP